MGSNSEIIITMENSQDRGHQITARAIMHNMLYDNGCINRIKPDGLKRYPKKIFNQITKACGLFFEAHPELLTEDNLDEIGCGMEEENEAKFGIYPEYELLNNLLNEYFDIM